MPLRLAARSVKLMTHDPTFGLDTFLLARTHSASQAAVNVFLQVVGGLLAVWVGYQFGAKTA